MAKQEYMTVMLLHEFLQEFKTDTVGQYQVWLALDEEGNEILPLSSNPELCCKIDIKKQKIIFFPMHRLPHEGDQT